MSKQKHQTEEKLMATWYKVVDFFEKNKKHVYTALTILVIAIAGIVIMVNKKKANNELAAIELGKIKPVYNDNNFQQAINGDSLGVSKGLLFIVNEYGSTENGEMAKIMLAKCFYALRDFDNAEKYFKDYSGNNQLLQTDAAAGIASVYVAREQYLDAAKQFEKVANMDKSNPFNDQYLFYAGKNYYKAEKYDEAKKLFANLKEEYPKSRYNAESDKIKATFN